MNSIDELFKPVTNGKRKLAVNHDADAAYKSVKASYNDAAKSSHRMSGDEDDLEAGPELPPDDLSEGDEDGRFFGGGVSQRAAVALDYLDGHETEASEQNIDAQWVRRLALSFERKISKNSELRARYENEPQKFMGSEADLDTEVKTLSNLSQYPHLYPEFVKLGCSASLVSLLAHENTDIAIDAIEIIDELTDDSVNAEQDQWDVLVDALLQADLLALLHENLLRMDEKLESDRSGVYHVLAVLENLSSRASITTEIGGKTKFMDWLQHRIQAKESPVSQNKQYAAELLAILLQATSANRSIFCATNGIDTLLQLLSRYRKADPEKGSDEEEFVENLFDGLACCVDEAKGKQQFVDSEGIELCLIMIREGKLSRDRAVRILDHALSGPEGAPAALHLVEAAGLKDVFGLFMKKQDRETTEHCLGILASLLRFLPANSAERIRLQAKFAEKDRRSLTQLLAIRISIITKLSAVEHKIATTKQGLAIDERVQFADEWLARRLDAGLYVLQTIDTILAWQMAEDEEAKIFIQLGLEGLGHGGPEGVRRTIEEKLAIMKQDADQSDPVLLDVLATLLDCM